MVPVGLSEASFGYPATFSERGYFQQLVKTGAQGAQSRAAQTVEDGARSNRKK